MAGASRALLSQCGKKLGMHMNACLIERNSSTYPFLHAHICLDMHSISISLMLCGEYLSLYIWPHIQKIGWFLTAEKCHWFSLSLVAWSNSTVHLESGFNSLLCNNQWLVLTRSRLRSVYALILIVKKDVLNPWSQMLY